MLTNIIPAVELPPSMTPPTVISGSTPVSPPPPAVSPTLSSSQTQSQPKKLSAQNKIVIDGETVSWTKVQFFSF
jgi:hypothetical protein